jgi:sialate O-acetylesterase
VKANLTALLLLLLYVVPGARADVRLSPVFSSNMVLQRDVPSKISGWAASGETVVVKLGGKVIGHASGAGAITPWTVTLPVFSAGPVPDLTVEGNNTITLTNLLAGDV